ncbi:MAG: cation diffusion facilitator family transporter [Sarcina sp.]
MFSNLLIKTFVPNNKEITNEKVRSSYGYLASIVGIISNIILFIIKFSVGFISGSIAITADAFNNLSDVLSSIVTIVGFKLSKAPPDKEHPFGHGRMEYISAFIVSFLVIIVGLEFFKSSVERILNPAPVKFDLLPFILIILTVFVKLWLGYFNTKIGKKINSGAIKASGLDAFGDVFTSSCVALSFLAAKYTQFPIDGYVGGFISLFIIYAGITLLKETISSLLGEAPDPEFVAELEKAVLSYKYINGVHDIIVHNYGVGRAMASLHVEFPADVDILEMHDIIDLAEREISQKFNLYLTVHMDPIYVPKGEYAIIKDKISKMVEYNPLLKSMHDFRICNEDNKTIIRCDIVIDSEKAKKIMSDKEIVDSIVTNITSEYPQYECLITLDRDFH